MGYGNKTVRIEFPELSEEGDLIYVTILNPKLASKDKITPQEDLAIGTDGKPLDMRAATRSSYGVIAGLVREWHVYDADDESDNPEPLPLPATADMIERLPMAIITDLMKPILEAIAPKS